jgi:DNA-binding MarR family transcriptional regulator
MYPGRVARRPARIGFLLTQLGTQAAASFDTRARELGVSPAEAGVVRILARQPGMNQRDLADKLGTAQSRVVALVDRLESARLVTRVRSAADRRSQELSLTDAGRVLLGRLRSAAETQEEEVAAGLDERERDQLYELLLKLSGLRGLDPDVHPGYATRDGAPPAQDGR